LANAGPFEDEIAAEQRDDSVTALRILHSLADQGDVRAEERLGYLYYIGWGVPRDHGQAAKWYIKAADQGNASAMSSLGFMLRLGITQLDRQTLDEVVAWNRKAAGQGNALAQFSLGALAHAIWYGAPKEYQNYAEAVKWYRLAADQGLADAQFNLGTMYDEGLGVPQDFVQAHKWLNLAASRYLNDAKDIRDRALERRDEVAAKMTRTQIAAAQRLASEWKPK